MPWIVGRFLVPSTPPATSSAASKQSPSSGIITNTPETNSWLKPPTEALPSWQLNLALDMHVYLSTSPRGDVFSKGAVSSRRDEAAGLPHFVWKDITFGGWGDTRVVNYDIKFPEVWSFLYLVVLVVDCFAGSSCLIMGHCGQTYFWREMERTLIHIMINLIRWTFTTSENVCSLSPIFEVWNSGWIKPLISVLTPYMARVKNRKEKNLLSGKEEEEPEEDIPEVIYHIFKVPEDLLLIWI